MFFCQDRSTLGKLPYNTFSGCAHRRSQRLIALSYQKWQNHMLKAPIVVKLINLDIIVPMYGLHKIYDERETRTHKVFLVAWSTTSVTSI
jgi:hypothetical protein